jgi:hypothetical protein
VTDLSAVSRQVKLREDVARMAPVWERQRRQFTGYAPNVEALLAKLADRDFVQLAMAAYDRAQQAVGRQELARARYERLWGDRLAKAR